ncbi:isoprenylcysteine carboxylmethyltransferase family protein [Thalassotalea sp. Y01]|uniref:methyltransferase family protein n=1 Tax=Thalassotalea sp. Y01 TaxID=2729613 RepID=UPI0020071DA2|nr:isoprenylcysteine carboxylmethyltransferase family protein [Thalassotalea sp. Y01]
MSDITEFTRVYLAVFFSLVAAFYTVRIILMKRTTSEELVFPGERFCATWWNHIAFRFFRATIWMVCLFRLLFPEVDNYLGMFSSFDHPLIIFSGLILLTLGFVSTATIHYRLGEQWRSGIDPSGPAKIITSGIYRYTRNPMFCFVALAQLGFFLALPSFFSLTCFAIGLYTLNSQAEAEEKHLLELFPNQYPQYTNQVRRWI